MKHRLRQFDVAKVARTLGHVSYGKTYQTLSSKFLLTLKTRVLCLFLRQGFCVVSSGCLRNLSVTRLA